MTSPSTRRMVRIHEDVHLFIEGGEQFVDAVGQALDPYALQPMERRAPTLTIRQRSAPLELRELQNLAGDGWVTAYDGHTLYVLAGGRTCSFPGDDGVIEVEPGFPMRRLMTVVRPALQLALLERGTPVLHASCVEVDGRAVLVAGWSESGKTETALALVERGGSFVSDKWTLLLPGPRAGAFPIGIGIRRWVLRYLPQLRAALPGRARTQLRAAAIASAVTRPIRSSSWRGPLELLVDATRRAIELGDRTGLSPTQLRAAYGDTENPTRTPPIGLIAVLRNGLSAHVAVADGEAERLAVRLAVSAATEREPFMALRRRAAYAAARPATSDELLARDAAAIEAILDGVPLAEVTAPFPTDPRDVARKIASLL